MSTVDDRAVPVRRRRGRPPQISQERIVEAALRLGLDSFSMQGIADELKVTAPALYSHVAGRDEVLELVNAALRRRLEAFASPATGWREWLTDFAHSVRTHLASSASTLMVELRRPATSDRIHIGEQGLQMLIDEGLSPAEAGYAVWLVFRVAITAGPDQARSLSGFIDDTGQALGAGIAAELPATQAVHAALVSQDPGDPFDFDLGVVLGGVAQQVALRQSQTRVGPALTAGVRP